MVDENAKDADFLLDVLRTRRDRCRSELRRLRNTNGTRSQRLEVVGLLETARHDAERIRAGDGNHAPASWPHEADSEGPVDRFVFEAGAGDRSPDTLRRQFEQVIGQHRAWLSDYPGHLRRWNDHLKHAATVEGAIWEALARRALARYVDLIEPAEDRSGGGPDFRCVADDLVFYVEASCLRIAAATAATSLPDAELVGGSYDQPTERVCELAESKVRQAKTREDGPTLLLLGTLHQMAARCVMRGRLARRLLTGDLSIAFPVYSRDGEQVGHGPTFSRTDLHGAVFVGASGPLEAPIEARNRHVAAVLIGTESIFNERDPLDPPELLGCVHPEPIHAIDCHRLLPGVNFFALDEGWKAGRLAAREVVAKRSAAS